MSQESFLGSLPSFSKTAFSRTTPQLQYKQVRQIKERGAKKDDGSSLAVEECRPTITRQPAFPNAKDILLINGADPDCKYSGFSNLDSLFVYFTSMLTNPSRGKLQINQFPAAIHLLQ